MARGPDLRFAVIEDAAALLQMLPPPEEIVWPTDLGDQEAITAALVWMKRWLPRAKAAHDEHCRVVKARTALHLAMTNGTR